jgi:transposase
MKTCGLDVHKDTIFCAIYNGISYSIVQEFETLTNRIRDLGFYLQSEGVTCVAMESTGIYWIPVWDILLEMGFDLTLVNPFLIKQMPGRKSDVKDAQWISCLLYKDMLRSSVVPSAQIIQLRTYTRKYSKLQQQKTRSLTKMDTLLIKSGIRLSSCLSNLGNKSFMKVVCALLEGINDPAELEKLVYGNTLNKRSGKLRESLTGRMQEHLRIQLEWEKEAYDLYEKQTQDCLTQMEKICLEHYSQEMSLLTTIPGVSEISAMIIIAETGADMSIFESSGKLTGWAGLRPRNDESAGKYKCTAITKGNKYLRTILVQVAWGAVRTKGSFFMKTFNRLAMRKSRNKALIAVARKLLVVSWNLLTYKQPYNPSLVPIYDQSKLVKRMRYHQSEMLAIEKLLPAKK